MHDLDLVVLLQLDRRVVGPLDEPGPLGHIPEHEIVGSDLRSLYAPSDVRASEEKGYSNAQSTCCPLLRRRPL